MRGEDMLKRFLKEESGATAFVFAIAAPVFIGGITLAVELGHWHQKKSKLQDLADTTVVAAAQEIMLLGDGADFKFAGQGHAYENGFNFNNGNITLINPPAEGKFAGREDMVEVIMNRGQELYFAQFFGNKEFEMQTRATAAIIEGVPACILSLAPTSSNALSSGGSSNVDLFGCGLHANSNSNFAVNLDDVNTACISSAGGIQTSNATVLSECDAPEPFSRVLRDPYANVEIPSPLPGCNNSGGNRINRNLLELYPGRYCNRNVSFGRTIHFTQPGVYYFDGVDLGTNSSHSLIFGRGVSIVFLNGGTLNGVQGGTVDLTAPRENQLSAAEKDFAAVSIFFDPDTSIPDQTLRINGNSESQIEGVIYAPNANVRINGTGNSDSECTQIIANTVDFRGNAEFTNQNCESIGARQIGGLTGVALVE